MQRYFRLAEEGYADMSAHTFKRTFDLRGLGDRQAVEIAFLDETQAETPVVMLYATDPTALTRNAIPRSLFPHTLTVSFTADGLGSPHRETFQLLVTDDGILEMIAH
jgi:hypothetical protein